MGLPVASDFCAQASIEHQEPMIGTAAPGTSVWLGIEVREAWPRNAFDSVAVPEALRQRLAAWAEVIPGFRPQALRRPGREHCTEPAVFVALTDPDTDVVVRLDAASLDAVADIDLPSVVETLRAGGVPNGARRIQEPMVWVCVHGKRDRCCAKFGVPVYDAAAKAEGVEAWQTSHLGGHRYAATLLCLPKGLCYGRVGADDVEPMLRNHGRDRVHALGLLRGRSCWSASGQASIHFVRAHLGEMAVDGFSVQGEEGGDAGTRVRVASPQGSFDVTVQKRPVGGEAPPSCGKALEPVRGWFQVSLVPV